MVLGLATVLAVVFLALESSKSTGSTDRVPMLTVGGASATPPVAPGFVGLSLEYNAVTAYAGHDPAAVDPVLLRLIGNLNPGQAPVLRFGGDSGDHSWVPVPGVARPRGVTFTLSTRWLATAGALVRDLDARVILGLNLEANGIKLAYTEARALIAALGVSHVAALEIGNEPELYGTFSWYQRNGHGVNGRPRSYHLPAYIRDFVRFARRLPATPLAGPATGGPRWLRDVTEFLAGATRLGVVTVHRYPLQRCFVERGTPKYPSIPNLLAPASSGGLAASVAGDVASARAHGLPLRVDELNSVACAGQRGVSDTFASALWALDTLFALARVGVTGINLHTFPGGIYQPFTLRRAGRRWSAHVAPVYYGLMMFAQAAPAGSRLLSVSGSPSAAIRTWATRAPDGRIRVVLINDSAGRAQALSLRVPTGTGRATLESLQAPGLAATAGVTLGGRSFGAKSATGVLPGTPLIRAIAPAGGTYAVTLPAASAALLTLRAR